MKTISKNIKFIMIAFLAIISFNNLKAQFDPAAINIQDAIEERKGNLSTYSVPGPATDAYAWAVVGGTITSPAGASGSGTALDPYLVPFSLGMQSITVQWPADDNTITSISGNVSAQRKVTSGLITCPSLVQSMDVVLWSNATAAISNANYEICSGDATLGNITVNLTGAINFSYTYTVTGLDGVEGTDQVISSVDASTSTIVIPGNLVNTTSTDDQYYIVTLKGMNDAFQGDGTVVTTASTFTITVHPTVETGIISGDNTLNRR